jgi:polyribonucleotide nucleotidyltransferase
MTFKVRADQVKEVIGKWWSTINWIIEQTGVKIDLQDDGSGVITADNQENWQIAMDMIMQAIWSPSVWDTMTWKIARVEKYGVFVDLGKRKVWLCHAKQLGEWFIDPTQLYKIGESLAVTVTGIDTQWKIQLGKAA